LAWNDARRDRLDEGDESHAEPRPGQAEVVEHRRQRRHREAGRDGADQGDPVVRQSQQHRGDDGEDDDDQRTAHSG
jgi:hypothetical protein